MVKNEVEVLFSLHTNFFVSTCTCHIKLSTAYWLFILDIINYTYSVSLINLEDFERNLEMMQYTLSPQKGIKNYKISGQL
jgi:hypothetical protein